MASHRCRPTAKRTAIRMVEAFIETTDLSKLPRSHPLYSPPCLPVYYAVNPAFLTRAEEIARRAHDGQVEESTGDPYIRHVERVVALVDGADAKAVAWLHDVLEDTAVESDDLLAAGIPKTIVDAVIQLSRDPARPYAGYIHDIKESDSSLAISVKIADLRDHLRPNCPPRLRPRYEKALRLLTNVIEEYRDVIASHHADTGS